MAEAVNKVTYTKEQIIGSKKYAGEGGSPVGNYWNRENLIRLRKWIRKWKNT